MTSDPDNIDDFLFEDLEEIETLSALAQARDELFLASIHVERASSLVDTIQPLDRVELVEPLMQAQYGLGTLKTKFWQR